MLLSEIGQFIHNLSTFRFLAKEYPESLILNLLQDATKAALNNEKVIILIFTSSIIAGFTEIKYKITIEPLYILFHR